MCKDKATLCKAFQRLYHRQLLPLLRKGISAAVYTQLSDVEGEINGLLTYDRKAHKVETKM
jgi:hypothetical protein